MADLLTVKELTERVDISRATLYRYLEEGLPYVTVGANKKMFVLEDVEDFIQKRKNSTASFVEGKEYTAEEISKCLRVGMHGAVRVSNSKNVLVLISCYFTEESCLQNYWDGDVLYFYGEGKEGDQDLTSSGNKALLESKRDGKTVYLFESFTQRKFKYSGIVELAGDVIVESVKDNELRRNVLKFPLKLKNKYHFPLEADLVSEDIVIQRKIASMSLSRLSQYAKLLSKPITKRNVITYRIYGDPYIRQYAKLRADGHCELCGEKAPFEMNGVPYLEIDHIVSLSAGGLDTVDNVVALCPNCHRKKHCLSLEEDINTIYKNVAENEARLQKGLNTIITDKKCREEEKA